VGQLTFNKTSVTNDIASDLDLSPEERWQNWANDHPTNFWVMTRKANDLVEDKHWAEAKPICNNWLKLIPTMWAPTAPTVCSPPRIARSVKPFRARSPGTFRRKDDEAQDAYGRLMELGVADKNWTSVETNALRYLAVNPLVAPPYRYLAQASDQTKNAAHGIAAYRALLELDPPDLAETHFRLAELLERTGDSSARRHVLQALEEAPRYPAALRLLLEINKNRRRRTRLRHDAGKQRMKKFGLIVFVLLLCAAALLAQRRRGGRGYGGWGGYGGEGYFPDDMQFAPLAKFHPTARAPQIGPTKPALKKTFSPSPACGGIAANTPARGEPASGQPIFPTAT